MSSRKINRRISESDDEIEDKTTPDNNLNSTPLRSSERLRAKSERVYSKPKRRETLDKIDDKKYIKYEGRSLKPRRLISDLVRGKNRYVTDRHETFYSDDSSLSDFIDDEEFEIKTQKKSRRKKKRRKSRDISDETESGDDETNTGRKSRRKKRIESSSDEVQSEDDKVEMISSENVEEDIGSMINSRRKRKKPQNTTSSEEDSSSIEVEQKKKVNKHNKLLSDDESSSSDDKETELQLSKIRSSASNKFISTESDEQEQPNRKLPKRTRSAKKKKEEVLLAKLVEKRKTIKNNEDTSVTGNKLRHEKSADIHTTGISSCDTQDTQYEDLNSADIFEEGESDREFVVDNDYEDFDFKHDDLHATVGNDLRMTGEKSNSFERIFIRESNDSDNETIVESAILLDVWKAIKENNIERVKSALETNPSIVNELGPKRRTLLHYAVMCASLEIIKLLLSFKADIFATDSYLLQPISYAFLTGHIDSLRLFLECTGIDLEELNKMYMNNFKYSLLHFIIYKQTSFPDLKCEVLGNCGLMVQCLQNLFECDKDLFLKLMSEKDSQGFTPLAAAITTGNTQCVEYLLCNEASLDDYHGNEGGNLLHLAVEYSPEEGDRASLLRVLLQTGLKDHIDHSDNLGFTPLMNAAHDGNHDCVLALLEAGASVSCTDLNGATSLHLAAASGDTQCVELLLRYRHKVDCLDNYGWPPLLYANFSAQESCVLAIMKPNPKQIFVLGDLLQRGKSEAARERNFKVVKDVLIALANQDAYYRVFNDFIRQNPNFLDEYDRGLLHKTWKALLDYDNKLRWFKHKLAKLRGDNDHHENYLEDFRHIGLKVDREAVFESARKELDRFSSEMLRRSRLNVTFKNESGICTGPKREFFVNLCKDIVGENHQLFHLTDENQYSFLPNAYFAEMAKIQGPPVKDEKSSDLPRDAPRDFRLDTPHDPSISLDTPRESSISLDTPQDSSISLDTPQDSSISLDTPQDSSISLDTLQDSSISLETPRDPSISLDTLRDPSISLDTPQDSSISLETPRDSSISLETPRDSSISLETPRDPNISLDTLRDPSISLDTPRDPNISLDTPQDPIVETLNLSAADLAEIDDDVTIAEVDLNPIVNSNINVDTNGQSCRTTEDSMETVENSTEGHAPCSPYVGANEIDVCSKDSRMNTEMNKIPTVTAETKKQEFARYVDKKLTTNISQLKFLGRIIGMAIIEGFFINLHLCKTLVKQILGMKLNHPDDLSSFDHELHKNLVTSVLESDDVEALDLPCTLEVSNPWNKRLTPVTLFSDERSEESLDEKNKVEYVNLVSQHKLTVLIKKEIDTLCQGLYEIIPKSLFSLFTADEFSLLINGVDKIDVEDWRKNTVYRPLNAESTYNEIKWFWDVVKDLKEDEKALLLKFSTGSPCLPAGGFSELQGLGGAKKFTISMQTEYYNKIPTASTCFNLLKLPKYDSIKDLKDKVLIAIRHGTEGFSFL